MNVSLNADWLVFTTHGLLFFSEPPKDELLFDFLEPPKDGAVADFVFKLVLLQVAAMGDFVDLEVPMVVLVATTGNRILWSGLTNWLLREPEI